MDNVLDGVHFGTLTDLQFMTYLTLRSSHICNHCWKVARAKANYSIAIDLLIQRFGDKERAHMDYLMSIEAVLSDSHFVELRKLMITLNPVLDH